MALYKCCIIIIIIKGVDLTGLLGGHKRRLGSGEWKSHSEVQGQTPDMGSGDVSQKLKLFSETTHICIKIQQTK